MALGQLFQIAVVFGAISVCPAIVCGQERPKPPELTDEGEPRIPTGPSRDVIARLARYGISVDDDEALIRAIEEQRPGWAIAPVVLGWRPKTEASVRALRHAAASDNFFIALGAYTSLARLGDQQWLSDASELLNKLENRSSRLQLAALLAKYGRYDGWEFVREAVLSVDDQRSLIEAWVAAMAFRHMKDGDGVAGAAFRELRKENSRARPATRNGLADMLRFYVPADVLDPPRTRQ